MQLYSTNDIKNIVSLKEAILKGLPEDKGLFMPCDIPVLPDSFFNELKSMSFVEIAYAVAQHLFKGIIPESDLSEIISQAINFPAPVVELNDQIKVLELFHGPSLAFKDFGARFMAQMMSYYNKGVNKELVILVATSGDTGGAVAAGFYDTPGIKVVILYPSQKVSLLQEKQLTTLGKNIAAIEVEGTFDDCQALVKTAFLDPSINTTIRLASANSINIARLIPQSFYYFEAYKQLKSTQPVVFSIPSGNFGNLTAGLFAKRMGLPVHRFIAATNSNDVVPEYLNTGTFKARPSVRTLSNAMDVGNPSNFARMKDLYGSTWNKIKQDILGYSFNDQQTTEAVQAIAKEFNYTIDPHGAVGYLALKEYLKTNPTHQGVILETAHPSKFIDDMESILDRKIDIPERLAVLANKTKTATFMDNSYVKFKNYLLENYS